MLSGQPIEVPSVFRTSHTSLKQFSGPNKIIIKIITGQEEYAERTIQLPANIGRAVDWRVRPSPRNGLFVSPFLSRHHAVIKLDKNGGVDRVILSCHDYVGSCGRPWLH